MEVGIRAGEYEFMEETMLQEVRRICMSGDNSIFGVVAMALKYLVTLDHLGNFCFLQTGLFNGNTGILYSCCNDLLKNLVLPSVVFYLHY